MNTKTIVKMGLVAAIYVVLTMVMPPMSFGFIQFRMASMLKCLILKDRKYVFAIVIGVIIANLFSPYAGVWELVFMPFITILAGEVVYRLKRYPYIALLGNGFITAVGVGIMLKIIIGVPFWITLISVTISETVLMVIGQKVFVRYVDAAFSKWGNHSNREI